MGISGERNVDIREAPLFAQDSHPLAASMLKIGHPKRYISAHTTVLANRRSPEHTEVQCHAKRSFLQASQSFIYLDTSQLNSVTNMNARYQDNLISESELGEMCGHAASNTSHSHFTSQRADLYLVTAERLYQLSFFIPSTSFAHRLN